ncbi:hypothetical protein BHE74_00038535 [Ensete ventricosum]|nr:hypothetical protein BHE74_00038535 [Ensete ventricosum]
MMAWRATPRRRRHRGNPDMSIHPHLRDKDPPIPHLVVTLALSPPWAEEKEGAAHSPLVVVECRKAEVVALWDVDYCLPPRNEHREWPEALLAIGTFGIKDMKQDPPQIAENLDASEDLPDFTVEEVNTLQKELAKLLSRKPKCNTRGSQIAEEEEEEEEEGGGGRANLPLNRFLNCPSSLEVDRTTSLKLDNRGDLSPYTKVMLSKAKDALLGNRNAVKKKSLSFLLKKIFVCGSGFEPPPSFRDPIPEPRIEKISFWRSRNQYGQQSVDVYEGSHGREDSPTQMGFGRYAKNCLGVEGILPSTET